VKTQAGNPGNRRVAQPSLFGSGLGFRQCGCLILVRCLSSFTVWESDTKTRNGKRLGTRSSQFDPTTGSLSPLNGEKSLPGIRRAVAAQ